MSDQTPLARLWVYLSTTKAGIDWANRVAKDATDEADEDLEAHAAAVAQVQDMIRGLRDLEGYLTMRMGKVVRDTKAERLGVLGDGRQWRLHRTADRKAWQHDDWKRDARKAVQAEIEDVLEDGGEVVIYRVDPETGVAMSLEVGRIIQDAMTRVQEFHGAAAPRVGTLKAHGLEPSDYCEQVPGNWKLDAIAPSENHDQKD